MEGKLVIAEELLGNILQQCAHIVSARQPPNYNESEQARLRALALILRAFDKASVQGNAKAEPSE